MRVVIAPDKFAGTLTAIEAAAAIAAGWRASAPDDELILVPLSDGGPGFIDVIHARRGGTLLAVTVPGPLGALAPAAVLVDGSAGDGSDGVVAGSATTAYVESAQACGLDLLAADERDPTRTTSFGVGVLVDAALAAGGERSGGDGVAGSPVSGAAWSPVSGAVPGAAPRRLVVGLGGSATNDGGAGLLAALGAVVTEGPADGLRRGGLALTEVSGIDLAPARARLEGVDLVVASDVDSPLAGPGGASMVYGAQKGATPQQAADLDAALQHWGRLTGVQVGRRPGAGAAGGLGHALMLLGGRRVHGIELVMDLVGLAGEIAAADLVLTGEGTLDHQSMRGKVPTGVAYVAGRLGRPVVALAGRVEVGRRELATMGIESAYAIAATHAEARAAMARPAETLAALAERVARTWSRR